MKSSSVNARPLHPSILRTCIFTLVNLFLLWLLALCCLFVMMLIMNVLHSHSSIFEAVKNILFNLWHAIFVSVINISLTKLSIVLRWIPLLILSITLSLIDGLVQRDIRKFQGARESSFIFHRVKYLFSMCFYFPLFFYFVYPVDIDEQWFLLPMLIALSLLTYLSAKHFKKYL